MTVSPELDRRFRDRAAADGLLDVAYDFADTPMGTLLLAASARGLCRVSFDPEPDREVEASPPASGRACSARRASWTSRGGSSTSTSRVAAACSTSSPTSAA